jgi:hypothetical protein
MAKASTMWSAKLYSWDVPAALVGFAAACFLRRIPLGSVSVLWWGAPVAFVALRRAVLPQLTPASDPSRPPPSMGRRVGAYACLIVGGFIALIAGLFFYMAATDAKQPGFAWPALLVLGFGGGIAALGVRWLT